MNHEYHILIAWENAKIKSQDIFKEFPSNLSLVLSFSYHWDTDIANRNYAAFYGDKLENIQYKVDHCGSGSFRVFVVCDNAPNYAIRATSKGNRVVNTTMFDLKTKLRELSNGGHLIHGSDSVKEANLNAVSLFGKNLTSVIEEYISEYTGKPLLIERNISGALGWESWEALFSAIENCTKYVVLRNIQTVTEGNHLNHGDTDLLVEDIEAAITLIAGEKEYPGKQRVLYRAHIGNSSQLIDLRHLGDDYYCIAWEKDILETRIKYNDTKIYVPNKENLKYSLLYHALVHKISISNDYGLILAEYFGLPNREKYIDQLTKFINMKGYYYCLPKDNSVYVNPDFYKYIKVPFLRKLICKTKLYVHGEYNGKTQGCNKKIFKILYKGYYMVIGKLRRIKATIKQARNN